MIAELYVIASLAVRDCLIAGLQGRFQYVIAELYVIASLAVRDTCMTTAGIISLAPHTSYIPLTEYLATYLPLA